MKVPPPALVRPPPLIAPPNVEDRLLVDPTVRVLLLSATFPVPVRAPRVWLAPSDRVVEAARSTAARVPRALRTVGRRVPPVTFTWVPLTRLVAADLRTRVPAPDLVIVRAVPPSSSAPRLRVPTPVPLLSTLNPAAPLRVVLPRVRV